MLHVYVSETFGVNVSSALAGVSEVAIFNALNQIPEQVPHTHSCNVKKPWCYKCPKCCYVFLGMSAVLPTEIIIATFGTTNMLDDPDNEFHYRSLFGLEPQTPFECVGTVEDSLLLMQLGLKNGTLSGCVLDKILATEKLNNVQLASENIVFSKLRGPANIQKAITTLFSPSEQEVTRN